VSIARRVQDPLSELVKIDPKAIGIGQYQHDVNQKFLNESLDFVVETSVNQVGVNVNTASHILLQHVAGLSPSISRNIVKYREENKGFKSR
ncbi:helix-hairpin-helix domain-containing protein, partial [Planococcus sp. SIMBA_143]